MTRPLAVVSSDLHIEYSSYASHPTMWGDSYYSLEQLVSRALELSVPLILAGDLFDKAHPDSFSLKTTFKLLNRMAQARLPVLFTQGQHELSRRQPWLSLSDWPQHIHGKRFRLGEAVFYGLDFQPADSLKAYLSKITPDMDVLVCHQVWGEFMGDRCVPEGYLAEVPFVRTVITGDFHAHVSRKIITNDPERELTVLSPGSTCLQSVSEDPKKYFYVLNDDLSFYSVPLDTRSVIYSNVVSDGQLQPAIDAFLAEAERLKEANAAQPSHIQTPIWYVRLHTQVQDAYARLKKAAALRCHFFPKLVQPDSSTSPTGEKYPAVTDLAEALTQAGVDRHHPLYATAVRLLSCSEDGIRQEVAALTEELLAANRAAGCAGTTDDAADQFGMFPS